MNLVEIDSAGERRKLDLDPSAPPGHIDGYLCSLIDAPFGGARRNRQAQGKKQSANQSQHRPWPSPAMAT